jgi:hypothetical protein
MLARAILVLLFSGTSGVTETAPAAVEPVALGTLVTVPALTPLHIRIDAELSSKKSRNGDRFPIHVDEDVRIGDVVVIPAGSVGEGEVIHAAKSGSGGKPGELLVAARFIRVGEQEIRLRSFSLGAKGRDRSNAALGTGVVLGPLALFVVGGVMTIPSGTAGDAKTATEIQLPAIAPTSVTTGQGAVD